MYLNIYRLKSLGGGRLGWSLAEPPPAGWSLRQLVGWGAECTAFRHVHLRGVRWEHQRLCQRVFLAAARHWPPEAAAVGQPQVQPDAGKKETAALRKTGSWTWADAVGELLQRARQTVLQSIFSDSSKPAQNRLSPAHCSASPTWFIQPTSRL